MAFCHGSGDPRADPFTGGCCYVNGGICPLRWYLDWTSPEGEVFDAARVSLGTVDDVIRSLAGNNPNRRARIFEQVQGITFLCTAALAAIDDDPSILTDRAAFDAAWEATVEYQTIADLWEAGGKPRNWCMTYGPSEGQCCHAETAQEQADREASMSVTAVSLRRGASGAS